MKTVYPVSSFDVGVRDALQQIGGEIKVGKVLLPDEATVTPVVSKSSNGGRYYTHIISIQCSGVSLLHVLSEALSKLYLRESEEGQKYVRDYSL